MAKNTVESWDTTASNNTDIGGIPILGTSPVSGFDGALRTNMSQISTYTSKLQQVVTSRTLLKAVDTTKYTVAYLKETDRQGTFLWTLGDFSAEVAADTGEWIYVKATAIAATVGAWVRSENGFPILAEDRDAIKALSTVRFSVAYLTESPRQGIFQWTLGNFAARVTADTEEGIYLASDDVATTVGAWVRVLEGYVTPQMFGAVADWTGDIDEAGTGTNDRVAIAAALKFAAGLHTVYFPAGVYYVSGGIIRLYAGTTLTGEPGAHIHSNNTQGGTFLNGISGTDYATGYDGDGDIHVEGLTFSMNLDRDVSASQGAYFQIGHAENITFIGCQFLNLYRGHAIELNAVYHGLVDRCSFKGQVVLGGDTGRDAINIDFAYATGFPIMGAYDNTPCNDITVQNCHFEGMQSGAAAHGSTMPTIFPKQIRILNNTHVDMTEYAIRCRYWKNCLISGNLIVNCPDKAIYLDTCYDTVIENNIIREAAQVENTHAVQFTDCVRCIARNNVITNADVATKYLYAYRVLSGNTGIIIETGGLAVSGSSGIVSATANGTKINGALYYSLSDDTAVAIPMERDTAQGIVCIATESAQSYSWRGFAWMRVSGTATNTLISKATAANTAETTGILTGTTGADGFVTTSAHTNGNIYIENRTGSGVAFDVTFL